MKLSFVRIIVILVIFVDRMSEMECRSVTANSHQRRTNNQLLRERIHQTRVRNEDSMMNSEETTVPIQTMEVIFTNSESDEIYDNSETRTQEACCPVIKQITSPRGGWNKNGNFVELYHGSVPQQFFETKCDPDIVNKSCRFLKHPKYMSTCTQEYSFVYALVKSENESSQHPWSLDYVQIQSGCSCQVSRK